MSERTPRPGVGLATTFFFLFLAFFGGIVQGAQSLVAAADGAQDNRRIRLAGGAGVVLGVVCGVVAVLLLAVGYRPLLDLTVSDPQIAAATSRYLQMRLGGLPFTLVGMGLVGVLQGLGDTRTRMWVSLIGNGVNIMLDSVQIFGFYPIPEMGEAGAGLATAISAFVMASLYLMRYVERLKWPIRPTREVVRSAIKLGMPMGAMHAMSVLAFVVMSLILARIGAVHLAASEIVLHVISLSFLPGFGISEAGGILVGALSRGRGTADGGSRVELSPVAGHDTHGCLWRTVRRERRLDRDDVYARSRGGWHWPRT